MGVKLEADDEDYAKLVGKQDVIVSNNVVYVKNTNGTFDKLRIKRHLIDHDFSPVRPEEGLD